MKKNNYLKLIVSLLGHIVISIILLGTIYKFSFNTKNISDSIFIPSILIFIFSLGINVGAGNIFNPIKYTTKRIFSRNKNSDIPKTYSEYVENKRLKEKELDYESPWYITISSLIMLFVAFILTII